LEFCKDQHDQAIQAGVDYLSLTFRAFWNDGHRSTVGRDEKKLISAVSVVGRPRGSHPVLDDY